MDSSERTEKYWANEVRWHKSFRRAYLKVFGSEDSLAFLDRTIAKLEKSGKTRRAYQVKIDLLRELVHSNETQASHELVNDLIASIKYAEYWEPLDVSQMIYDDLRDPKKALKFMTAYISEQEGRGEVESLHGLVNCYLYQNLFLVATGAKMKDCLVPLQKANSLMLSIFVSSDIFFLCVKELNNLGKSPGPEYSWVAESVWQQLRASKHFGGNNERKKIKRCEEILVKTGTQWDLLSG